MTKAEFEALLKLQDRRLLMCRVVKVFHKDQQILHAADVVNKRTDTIMNGDPKKTPSAAVQSSIAKYYRQNANH
jgi:hypothetical protein